MAIVKLDEVALVPDMAAEALLPIVIV